MDLPATAEAEAARLAELLRRMRARDQNALATLYDLTVDRVFAVAVRVLHNEADAEEIVCDTFRQAWERADRYDPDRGGVLSWLLVMAWSRSVDRLRRQRAQRLEEPLHPEGEDSAYTLREDDQADRVLAAYETGSAVREALQTLNAQQRELIGQAFLQGLTHSEIAETTGLPMGTVKSRIRRGLEILRRHLGAHAPGNET